MSIKETMRYEKGIIYAFLLFILLAFLYLAWTGNEIRALLLGLEDQLNSLAK